MSASHEELIDVTTEIVREYYSEAASVFLAGSLVRGEGTSTSDLDLVVVFEQLDCAYRESFEFGGWPVEAFAHDAQTLRYFFDCVDREAGIPSLARMVSEGIEIPAISDFGKRMKQMANAAIDAGPPVWTQQDIDASRYAITNLVDDMKDPRSKAEAFGTLAALYPLLANHYLRSRGLWGAKDKSIPRALTAHNAGFADRFGTAFESAVMGSHPTAVIDLAAEILQPEGGRLFAGYSRSAPKDWRWNDRIVP